MMMQSCGTPEYLSEAALFGYILDEDNGLSKSIASGNILIKITSKSTDLLVAQELKNSSDQSADRISSLRAKYDSYYYFILSLSNSGQEVLGNSSGTHAEFSDLLQTISFRMGEVVNMTTAARDTIPLADFIYNRTFGLSSSTDVLLVFDKSATKDVESIQINLDEFGLGVGKQSIAFKTADLNTTPRIYKD